MRQDDFILCIEFINFIVEHLLVGILPEKDAEAQERSKAHQLQTGKIKLFPKFRRQSVEVSDKKTIHKVLDEHSEHCNWVK